jgi:hypothetical protein
MISWMSSRPSSPPRASSLGVSNLAYEEAIDWLRNWLPHGPWTVIADNEGGRRSRWEVRQFLPGQEAELTLWLEDNNGRNNIYFVENLPLQGLRTSPTEAEIIGYLAVPLDVDLPVGIQEEDREEVLQRIRTIEPPPTAIVWSGGGYQGHWRFDGPQPMEIGPRVREQTLALARAMGGDHIQNPNRLMRLPGTRNVLNARSAPRAGSQPTPMWLRSIGSAATNLPPRSRRPLAAPPHRRPAPPRPLVGSTRPGGTGSFLGTPPSCARGTRRAPPRSSRWPVTSRAGAGKRGPSPRCSLTAP